MEPPTSLWIVLVILLVIIVIGRSATIRSNVSHIA